MRIHCSKTIRQLRCIALKLRSLAECEFAYQRISRNSKTKGLKSKGNEDVTVDRSANHCLRYRLCRYGIYFFDSFVSCIRGISYAGGQPNSTNFSRWVCGVSC